ncbi:hypothetical protein CFP65_1050 [Kitasatospora sp. MMS16-BH015]|uniref:endolytic transglycosylase MltG n=1 Tax=Kitasatospora sp. MMS16-BH015 TaxID=2018025 RepID=UPI000CA3EA7D|nr:endolytic transglycosylase MltG [Kitasatospora sp. MMS16-BH015]AUG75967.1 hypothetical protein CFP65_1050 [Kitasatospora sp. MMS16-BH015]
MSDLGGGYNPQGSQPWHPGDPGYGGTPEEQAAAQQAAWQQQNQYAQDPYGQQQQTGAWQQVGQQQHQQQGQYAQDLYAQQQAQQQQLWQQQQQQQQAQAQQAQQQTGAWQQVGQQHQQQGQYTQDPYGRPQAQQQQMPQQGQQQWQQGMQQGLQTQGLRQAAQQTGLQQQGMPAQGLQQGMPQQQGFQQQGGPQGFPPGGQPGQPGRPGPGGPLGQQAQQPFGQQGQPGQPGRFGQQQAAGRPPVQQQRSAPAPAGPGPDGIDWEAEAAALEHGGPAGAGAPAVTEPEPEVWAEEHGEEYEDEYHEEGQGSFLGEQDTSREGERKRKEKGKAAGRRNSGACLVVALVLLGGLGGAGWWGYGFYQRHFGPPADYAGAGTGSVSIQIKPGAAGEQMGQTLFEAGVVKSVKAFYNAFVANPKASTIQPGAYTMHHQMSAESAVALLVDSNGGNALVIPEGKKAADIYTIIDGKLKLNKGTTAQAAQAHAGELGLPQYANNNPEGFLFPAKYSITEGMKPEDLLKQMVANATQHYKDLNLDGNAQKIGLNNGYEVLTEASILQAEGNNDQDFGKIARVLYNRLKTNATQGKLQLDTTLQYKLGRTNFTKAEKDGDKSPYNTYVNKGLPPTPISNPGDEAIQAVLNPTAGDWVYFVALSPTETRFSTTFDQFKKDVKDYCSAHNQGFDEAQGMCK